MKIRTINEGVVFSQDKRRLTVMLLVPLYSFWPEFETRRVGCPIGLELIASELVAKGFNVVFIDACMAGYDQFTAQPDGSVRYGLTDGQLEAILAGFQPDIVGITSMFSNQAANVNKVAWLAKRAYPNAIIVEGGSHATGMVEEVLRNDCVDMVVREEGLVTFTDLCLSIESETSSACRPGVLGVSYKDEDGKINHNPSRPFLENLDDLAPRRLEIPLHLMYDTPEHTGGSRFHSLGRHAYVLSSMGCPLKCDFCHIHQMAGTIRYFSLKRFEHEMMRFREAGVSEVIIEDDMLFADVPRALEICAILKRHGLDWFEEGGLSMFKFMQPGSGLTYRDVVDKLAASGCYRIYLAIESANRESLKKINKPHINTQADLAADIVRYLAEKGIEAVGGFMLGFRGGLDEFEETFADLQRTVEYAKRLKEAGLAYVYFAIYTAIPGTKTYADLKPVFPDLDLMASHERAAFPIAGMEPLEFTRQRLAWMREVNGEPSMDLSNQTKNWGL